jgi:hypothetical protein
MAKNASVSRVYSSSGILDRHVTDDYTKNVYVLYVVSSMLKNLTLIKTLHCHMGERMDSVCGRGMAALPTRNFLSVWNCIIQR